MNPSLTTPHARAPHAPLAVRPVRFALSLVALALALVAPVSAQKTAPRQKLPSADKIVGNYLKAAGGRKRLAAVADATYEWSVQGEGQAGRATTRTKAPDSSATTIESGGGGLSFGATPRAAWTRGRDGQVRTLTDAAARAARLRAALDATRLVDFKKLNLTAVTVGAEQSGGEQAYVVEFRSRDGARARYLFGAASKLLLAIADTEGHTLARFSDYRAEGGVLEPHRIELSLADAGTVTLALRSVSRNTNLAGSLFDAPRAEDLDARAVLKEVIEKEPATNVKFDEFTFTIKHTERELNDKGEPTKETSRAWDIFMTPAGQSVGKLVEVDGKPLPTAEAAKQEKLVADFLAAHEKDKPDPNRGKGAGGFHIKLTDDLGFGLADLLRASEFVSPRRETFKGRESIVFDYRARPDFRPKTKNDEILKKIVGLIWIDAAEKVVARIEARLTDDFKLGGGLLMNIKGAGFVFERVRLDDGYWVPGFYQWNANGKGFIFLKRSIYEITEWANYKRFKVESDEGKIAGPAKTP